MEAIKITKNNNNCQDDFEHFIFKNLSPEAKKKYKKLLIIYEMLEKDLNFKIKKILNNFITIIYDEIKAEL